VVNDFGGDASTAVGSDVFRPTGTADTGAVRVAKRGKEVYDSGVVAAGADITSGLLDLSGVDSIGFVVNNAGAATRNLNLLIYRDDGTTLLATLLLRAVAAGATEVVNVGHGAINSGVSAAWSLTLPTKVKVQLATAGAANGRVTVFSR
jgi:hypothetical protein